jgi:ubiquinone/menaquinone biosynthesis C-methylase UbiE
MLGVRPGMEILDVGCGNGFFTFALANKYLGSRVIGIDNAEKQIVAAQEIQRNTKIENIDFILGDIQTGTLPKSDAIIAPFVFGYFDDEKLYKVLKNIFDALDKDGLLIVVLDDPKGIDNSRFGAKKTVSNGALSIELFDKDSKYITTLKAIYHDIDSFKQKLTESGFKDITEYSPIIDKAGFDALGESFWNGYTENSELVYLSCTK